MSMGGGGGTQTTPSTVTSNSNPWSGAQPALTQGIEAAQTQFGQGPSQYFPDQTVVPFSGQTEQALTGIENTANNQAGGVLPGAISQAQRTISGGMLNNNPWLDQTFNQAGNAVQGRLGSMFGGSVGGFGSGAHRAAAADQLNNLATSIYGGNYGAERGLQQQAMMAAPQFESMRYDPYRQLQQVGAAREGQAGAELQSDISRWNYNQNAPWENIQRLMATAGGGQYGGSSTTTTPYYSNPMATYGGLGIGLLNALSGARGVGLF